MASAARAGRTVHDLQGVWFVPGTSWPDLHWDLNLQYTYYLPNTINRFDIASTYLDFFEELTALGTLNRNVPAGWTDAAAAPTGASNLRGEMSCYWSYGPNCTTSPPSVTGNLFWCLQIMHMVSVYSANSTIDKVLLWPLLDRALQFHSHFSTTAADGSIHLEATFSPE